MNKLNFRNLGIDQIKDIEVIETIEVETQQKEGLDKKEKPNESYLQPFTY